MKETDELVQAGRATQHLEDNFFESLKKSIPKFSDNSIIGHTNFILDEEGVLGYFNPIVITRDEEVIAFAARCAMIVDLEKTKDFIRKAAVEKKIRYSGNRDYYLIIDHEEVFNYSQKLNLIEGKVVIMGFVGNDMDESEDLHLTTFEESPEMYGVVIHANVIEMILNRL